MDVPETRYVKTADGVHIAYQVVGDGAIDIVYVARWFSNVDLIWEQPDLAPFLCALTALFAATFPEQTLGQVSSTVKDLAAGSGLVFEDAGEHEPRGVPERWHLYRVVDP